MSDMESKLGGAAPGLLKVEEKEWKVVDCSGRERFFDHRESALYVAREWLIDRTHERPAEWAPVSCRIGVMRRDVDGAYWLVDQFELCVFFDCDRFQGDAKNGAAECFSTINIDMPLPRALECSWSRESPILMGGEKDIQIRALIAQNQFLQGVIDDLKKDRDSAFQKLRYAYSKLNAANEALEQGEDGVASHLKRTREELDGVLADYTHLKKVAEHQAETIKGLQSQNRT